MANYDFQNIEKKWQKYWDETGTYRVRIDAAKPKYYVLDMFPYPSGAGLHVGHPLGYIASDIVARFKRQKGYNVLHPMGFDSFGLPAEQYAIQTGQHPAITTEKNIQRYKNQLKSLGLSYDWSAEIRTSDPSFYKWTQWIFKLIFGSWYNNVSNKAEPIETLISELEKKGNMSINAACDEDTPKISADQWKSYSEQAKEKFLLKYRLTYLSEIFVNWCPELGTVLSNDEVKDGFSERGGHPVLKKKMPQWSMRITAYTHRLLQGLEELDWPESIKEMQRNWIGKSIGAELSFRIEGHKQEISVFTTRIDTIFGVTFCVLAPECEWIDQITTPAQKDAVDSYVKDAVNRAERDRMSDTKKVSGVFTGAYAINPFNKERIPIWIADYVLGGYGTGAIMAVPAHDERDHRFAKHFKLPILQVIEGSTNTDEEAFSSRNAKVIHSDFLNGLPVEKAIQKAIAFAEEKGFGNAKVNFKLRDAIFGRQRYWGEPIPVFYEGESPKLVPDQDLPLVLPEVDEYLPTKEGEPPLGRAPDWTHEGKPFERSTMPGWAGSSWYFFRYMDPSNEEIFCGKKALDYWQDVDFYMGGSEHATGHLLYSRFWTKFLYDRGYVHVEEYAKKLVNQGMVQGRSNFVYRVTGENKYVSLGIKDQYSTTPIHVDVSIVKDDVLDVEAFRQLRKDTSEAEFLLEDGEYHCGWEIEKMSKSKYNVVNPDNLIEKYGADTLRMYEMFLGPVEQSKPWNTHGIEGVFRFLRKFWNLFYAGDQPNIADEFPSNAELKVLHATIKKIGQDIDRLSLNTCISTFMIAANELSALKCNKKSILEPLTIALAPFAPHMAEELWELLGHKTSVVDQPYPKYDEKYLLEDSFEYPVSVNGKMRARLSFPTNTPKETIEAEVLKNAVVIKWMDGKPLRKMIVVPEKIINVVV